MWSTVWPGQWKARSVAPSVLKIWPSSMFCWLDSGWFLNTVADDAESKDSASLTPPTWSGCQCVRMIRSICAFSSESAFCRESFHVGLPSPVSISIRFGPEPIRYVFVPCRVNLLGLPPRMRTTLGLSLSMSGR